MQNRPTLAAADTNVLLDLADEVDDVTESLLIIRRRIRKIEILLLPTVQEELAHEATEADEFENRERARNAFSLAREWNFRLREFLESEEQTARAIARHLRSRGLLPRDQINDSLLLAEAALQNCSLLLTSDEHLRGADFERLRFELLRFNVAVPVIATPREIVRKFFS